MGTLFGVSHMVGCDCCPGQRPMAEEWPGKAVVKAAKQIVLHTSDVVVTANREMQVELSTGHTTFVNTRFDGVTIVRTPSSGRIWVSAIHHGRRHRATLFDSQESVADMYLRELRERVAGSTN